MSELWRSKGHHITSIEDRPPHVLEFIAHDELMRMRCLELALCAHDLSGQPPRLASYDFRDALFEAAAHHYLQATGRDWPAWDGNQRDDGDDVAARVIKSVLGGWDDSDSARAEPSAYSPTKTGM